MKADALERLVLSVDIVVFTVKNNQLMYLTYLRKHEPFQNAFALPGAGVRMDETLDAAARRALADKTGWSAQNIFLDQLAAFDGLYRDPRGRTVSVAYMGLCSAKQNASNNLRWTTLSDLKLPFDHNLIVTTAVQRLQGKLRYTNIAKNFLSDTFRIEELQSVYEAVLQVRLNRTNFRNKLLKIKMIKKVSILNQAVGQQGGRPPHLYCFKQKLFTSLDRDFF